VRNINFLNENKRAKSILIVSLFLILLFVFLYRNLKVSELWAFGDLEAFPSNIRITQNWAFYIWNEDGLGRLFSGAFNYYLTIVLLSSIFGSSFAQKILFLSVPLVSFFTFFLLMRKLNVSLNASILGALAYSFNPITVSEFIGGSLAFLIIYPAFPIIFILSARIIRCQESCTRDAIALGVVCFFIFSIQIAIWYIIVLIPLLIFNLQKGYFRRILRFAIPLIIGFLILFPNILGSIGLYDSLSPRIGSLESDAAYNYGDSTFYNIARLAGNKGGAQAEEFMNYNTLNAYTILGYVIPLVAFLPFLSKNRHIERNKRILTMSTALAFLILSGVVLLLKDLPFLVTLNPVLGSLRNPAKLMYPLSFTLCFLLAMGTEQLLTLLSRKQNSRLRSIFVLILVTTILLYNYPAFDGTVGLDKFRDSNYYIPVKYFALPEVLEKIDKSYSNFGVLFLPWEYSALLKIRSQMPNYFGLSVGAGIYNNIDWLKSVFEVAVAEKSSNRSAILSIFGVKYVVIDKNFRSSNEGQEWYENLKKGRNYVIYESQDSYWVAGDYCYFYRIFNSDTNFKLVYDEGDFAIFENNAATTKLYTRSGAEDLTFSYTPVSENLLKNPSFKNNTEYWKTWPSNLVNITDDYNHIDEWLTLYGQEFLFTICSQEVSVRENASYRLGFSVMAHNITDMHAKVLWYNVTENLIEDDAFYADFIDLDKMNLKNGEWSNIQKDFFAPKGSKMAGIEFLANRLENFTSTIMCVDDISFCETAPIIENSKEFFSSMRNINYTKINPTKYLTKINATSTFVIAFSKTYSPSWVCYTNGKRVSSFSLYNAVNGFLINQTGQLDIIVEYEPQRWFYYGLIISVTTLLTCITYLTYNIHKKQKIWK
jgi:hypothetical protein